MLTGQLFPVPIPGSSGAALPLIGQSVYTRGGTVTITTPAAGSCLVFIVLTGPTGSLTNPVTVDLYYGPAALDSQRVAVYTRLCDGITDPTSYAFTSGDSLNIITLEVSGLKGLNIGMAATPTWGNLSPSGNAVGTPNFVLSGGNTTVTVAPVGAYGSPAIIVLAMMWDNNTAVSSTSLPTGWTNAHDFSAGSPAGNHYALVLQTDTASQSFGSKPAFTTAAAITTGLVVMPVYLLG